MSCWISLILPSPLFSPLKIRFLLCFACIIQLVIWIIFICFSIYLDFDIRRRSKPLIITSLRALKKYPSSLKVNHPSPLVFNLSFPGLLSSFAVALKSLLPFKILEKAFGDDGKLKQPKELSINKVGHGIFQSLISFFSFLFYSFWLACYFILFALCWVIRLTKFYFVFVGAALHELDPLYKEFTYSSKFSSLVSSLGYRRPVVMQSMYIFKVLFFCFVFFFLCWLLLRIRNYKNMQMINSWQGRSYTNNFRLSICSYISTIYVVLFPLLE